MFVYAMTGPRIVDIGHVLGSYLGHFKTTYVCCLKLSNFNYLYNGWLKRIDCSSK